MNSVMVYRLEARHNVMHHTDELKEMKGVLLLKHEIKVWILWDARLFPLFWNAMPLKNKNKRKGSRRDIAAVPVLPGLDAARAVGCFVTSSTLPYRHQKSEYRQSTTLLLTTEIVVYIY